MADAAGSQARPLAVTDVIRRGNRHRARGIAQRSLGGLSVAGIGTAAILTGAAAHHQAVPAAASGTSAGVVTMTERIDSAAGHMTLVVKFRREPHGMLKPISATCSGRSAIAVSNPSLELTVRSTGSPTAGFFIGLGEAKVHHFSVSFLKGIKPTKNPLVWKSGTALTVSLVGASHKKPAPPVLTEGMIVS